jgi:hypothetical protein
VALASIVGPPSTEGEEPRAEVYGWDWSATTHEAYHGVVDDLLAALEPALVLPGAGLQGWSQSVTAYDLEGYKLGSIYFGGSREDVHVRATSSAADATRRAVVNADKRRNARTARVDTRVDTLLSFEKLMVICEDVAGQKAQVTYVESRNCKTAGRTIYVGAPSSWVRVRVYEKWKQAPDEGWPEGTNRVEVQLRPPSRSKEQVSKWSPAETFCVSELTRRLAEALGQDIARPGSLQKSKGTPDLERTLEAMGEQYGNAYRKWMDASGGDMRTVFEYLAGRREGPQGVVSGPVTDDLRFPV